MAVLFFITKNNIWKFIIAYIYIILILLRKMSVISTIHIRINRVIWNLQHQANMSFIS